MSNIMKESFPSYFWNLKVKMRFVAKLNVLFKRAVLFQCREPLSYRSPAEQQGSTSGSMHFLYFHLYKIIQNYFGSLPHYAILYIFTFLSEV